MMMSEWEWKPWGRTLCLLADPSHNVHVLRTLAGGFSSRHYHRAKVNRFYVRTGRIIVREWKAGAVVSTPLGPGGIYDVPPLIVHQFEVVEGGSVWETYWPAWPNAVASPDDIVRLSENGINQDDSPAGIRTA